MKWTNNQSHLPLKGGNTKRMINMVEIIKSAGPSKSPDDLVVRNSNYLPLVPPHSIRFSSIPSSIKDGWFSLVKELKTIPTSILVINFLKCYLKKR